MPKTRPPISYTSRDFESIKKELVNYVKVYYPETYKDFNDSSFGAMMIDMVAYTGDVLSYYLDYQMNETFLETSIQENNVLKIAKQMGYKLPGYPSSTGICSFYVAVPAQSNGFQPNLELVPILKEGTLLTSDSGATFILAEDVDFNKTTSEIKVGDVNTNGTPTNYIYKAYGKVISGEIKTKTFNVGDYVKYYSLEMGDSNISEIVSIADSDGNEYYEVDYLAQDTVYKAVKNFGSDSATVPFVLKQFQTYRRFTTEFDINGNCKIQFGGGSEADFVESNFIDPTSVVLNFYGKNYDSDLTFDPNQIVKSEKLGISPANTTLTIKYRSNPSSNSNVPAGSITSVSTPIVEFKSNTYSTAQGLSLISTFEVENEDVIVGFVDVPTIDEVRLRALGATSSQNRAVTKQDYINLIYRMPGKYGAVKRVNVLQDPVSIKKDINIYIVSSNQNNELTISTEALKRNIKSWISNYKMINDVVDILDATIINIGIEFEIVVELNKDVNSVLAECLSVLKEKYTKKFEIGEPLYLTDIFKLLNNVKHVVDTRNVMITEKYGAGYSNAQFSAKENLSKDGRYLSIPQTHIFEIKDLDLDIRGVAV
jgi:hypothetical protein